MNEAEKPRYVVAMKKSYRRFFRVTAVLLFALLPPAAVSALRNSACASDFVTTGCILAAILLAGVGALAQPCRRCEAYRGRIEYITRFRKRTYRLSELASSQTRTEEIYVNHFDEPSTNSWDRVTVFYDKAGKKLFQFGLAYENVSRLERDVMNTRKSLANRKKKK